MGIETKRHVSDPRHHLGPMGELYDLVLGMVERRYDSETRELLAGWLHSARPTLAHMAVMMTEIRTAVPEIGASPRKSAHRNPSITPTRGLSE